MNNLLFDNWLEFLRSKRYKQIRNQLGKPNKKSYCCLGVACLVCIQQGIITEEEVIWNNSFPPTNIRSYFGLDSDAILWGTDKPKYSNKVMLVLSEMNDSGKFKFSDIADWLEKHREIYLSS
ncbi:hypothetical protein H6G33_10445 [Calothrix sp. FACHB-1219]|uniref:hypothetical protein n=1 Tax=unclassified Calothrix TaxID=2619626 RepID=UPI001685F565|nr:MULTISPECIES: hypothetical protein [unclassified Calothrix]MBD2201766.1 hypothetical protein [Calothrix sp. FACHB-168]MBD2217452.1 hypothetical protein [Calothrix sp. FACHB-1219]